MAEGWNPVWQPDLESFLAEKGYSVQELRFSHVAFFSKGQWVIVGITSLLTGIIDAGDYVNLLLILLAVPLFFHLLKEWQGLSPGITLLAAFSMAFHSVAFLELNSGRIDGNLVICFLLFLLSCVVWLKTGEKKWLPLLLGTAIYGCVLKYTAVVYFGLAGVMCSLPVVWDFLKRNRTDVNMRGGGQFGLFAA